MPQLDPNTFTYQYIGVISLLVIAYVTLSYIVLPIILRLMLVRGSFLTTKQNLSDLLNSIPPEQQFTASLKTPINSASLTNQVIGGLSLISYNSINLILTKLIPSNSISSASTIAANAGFSEFSLDYLILLLTADAEETNE